MDDSEFTAEECIDEAQYFEAGEYEFGDDPDADPIDYPAGFYSYDPDSDEWLLEEDDGGYALDIE